MPSHTKESCSNLPRSILKSELCPELEVEAVDTVHQDQENDAVAEVANESIRTDNRIDGDLNTNIADRITMESTENASMIQGLAIGSQLTNKDCKILPEPHCASPIREVLLTLQKEATKYRNIQETCNDAIEELSSNQKEVLTVRSYCFLPLKLAYDTKLPRFCILAVTGFRHLLSDPLLKASSLNPNKKPLAVKIVELILRCPGTNDEHLHEIYKLCLAIICTDLREVHHELIIKMLELCLDQAVKHKETSQKALAHSTFLQMLSQLPRNIPTEGPLPKSPEVEDLIAVVRWLVDKVPNRTTTVRQQTAVFEAYVKHYLDGLVTLLTSTPSTLVQHSEFTDIIWQNLCPALIQLLGNPMVDKAAQRGKVHTAQPHTIKDLLHIHSMSTEMTNSSTRSCHSIATQLVRLVGHQAFLRPVLASLFHRIIMFPPPHLRKHALDGVKEVFKNPQLLTDLCVVQENEVTRIDFALLKMLIDGVTQSSMCGDSTMLGMSASVIVALLDSIQQLSNSVGVTDQHRERIAGAIDDMDSHMQPTDDVGGGDESETVSETDEVFPSGPVPPVQAFFTSATPGELEHQQTDLVRTEREDDSDQELPAARESSCHGEQQDSSRDTEKNDAMVPDKQIEEVDVTDTVLATDPDVTDISTKGEHGDPNNSVAEGAESTAPATQACDVEEERRSAKNFVKSLLQALNHLLDIEDPHTLDLSIQQFASDMCATLRSESVQAHMLNADSMYVTTYMALDLTRRLHEAGYYSGSLSGATVTESQFLDWIQSSGGMILVSPIWIQEVYRTVLEVNMLELSEFDLSKSSTLLLLLQKFSQVQKTAQPSSPLTPCQRFARFLLSGTWEQVLQVLQNPIEAPHKLKARLSEVWSGSKSLTTRTDLICCCLDGLRRAASLSCKLGMQNKCTTVISHLANISCSSIKHHRVPLHKEVTASSATGGSCAVDNTPELRVAHVLSMDALLNVGLDVGQFESKCWKHVFKCCAYISYLEHNKFAHSHPTADETTAPSSRGGGGGGTLRELMLSEEAAEGGVAELLQQENQQDISNTPRGLFSGSYSGVLQTDVSMKAVALLAASADKLFSSAVSHLSTEPLRSFLEALVKSSQIQLFGRPLEHSTSPRTTKAMSRPLSAVATSILHLHRLTELVLVCSRSSHSLLNMMQVWSTVATHFTEAACHAERTISKLAITSYHQILTEVMRKRVELPHFSFNEALLKPMEDMLSLGLCDMETQDHIVSCLCELTEANAREMKSGWKALFRSLRSVKVPISNEEDTWTTPVFEVVSVVLERDDVFIFSDAIIDCVLCLQKFICSGSVQQSKDSVFSDPKIEAHNARLAVQLGLPSLKYLSRIATMLSIMYGLENRPLFAGSDRINVPSVGLGVDSEGRALFDFLPYNDKSGLLKVWWIMIQGMCSTVLECHQQVQAQTMETVYSMLRALAIIPGPQFQILVMCHELFPMLTSWAKKSSRLKWSQCENMESNFKHACGLAIELVCETIISLKTERERYDFDTRVAINSLLKHVMVLLTACVEQPLEGVARVGCSCIRHLLFSSGKQLGDHLNVVCLGLADACTASLQPVQHVLIPFNQPSRDEENGLVRVYARKDTPSAIASRLTALTRQVFLDEKQCCQADVVSTKDTLTAVSAEEKAEQYMRSYVIAWPPAPDRTTPSRVPFSDLVVGILAHSLLIQTINDLFVGDNHPTAHKPTGLSDLLTVLTPQTMSKLLDVVWDSYELCITFNNRPGLRYLIQKVGSLHDYTPGLVKQAQKSYITYINTILYLRINVKKQNEGADDARGGSSYSHAGLCLDSIDTSWEGILDTCLKEASRQLCTAYSHMEHTNMVRQAPSSPKKQAGRRDSSVSVPSGNVEERFSINDIEHWTSTVVSVLNMYYNLSDDMFSLLLPAIYPSAVELCVNVTDPLVRNSVKSILEKVGRLKNII